MRLIDADALLEDAAEVAEDYGDGYCEFGYSHKQIEEAPTIDPIKWIPCKDRLPEKEGHYIVTVVGFRAERFVRADYFAKGEFDLWQREAVAWAEMPEPWRGEEDE